MQKVTYFASYKKRTTFKVAGEHISWRSKKKSEKPIQWWNYILQVTI